MVNTTLGESMITEILICTVFETVKPIQSQFYQQYIYDAAQIIYVLLNAYQNTCKS